MEQILKRSWRWQSEEQPPPPKCSSKESDKKDEKEDEETQQGKGKSDGGQPEESESSGGGNTEKQDAKEQPNEDKSSEEPKPKKNKRTTWAEKKAEARAKLEWLLANKEIKNQDKMPTAKQLLNTIYRNDSSLFRKKEDIGEEADYYGIEVGRKRELEGQVFDPAGRLKTSIDDQLNHLTGEQLTGRYTHILQNAFYAMVERIGTDTYKMFDTRASDNMKYNMKELTARVVTKKPLSKCKEYLTKEQIFLFTDSSGSCSGVSKIINSISQIVSYRGDCILLVSPDCSYQNTDYFLSNREKKLRERKSKTYIVNEPPYIPPKYNKGQDHLFKHYIGGYHGSQKWFDIEQLKGKTLIMLTDADAYNKLPQLFAAGVKKIIFLDLFNYILSRPTVEKNKSGCIMRMQAEAPFEYRRYISSIECYEADIFNMLQESGERITSRILDENRIFNPNVLLSERFQWHYVYDATDLLKIFHTIK